MARTPLGGKCDNQRWRWVGGVFLGSRQRNTMRRTSDYGTEAGCGPIVSKFANIRKDTPGKTNKARHKIRTVDTIPI